MKNLHVINVQISLENGWDEQMVKEKFKQAEDTINQKFHGVSRRCYIVELWFHHSKKLLIFNIYVAGIS